MKPNQINELRELQDELEAHAEEMNELSTADFPANHFDAHVSGNVRPCIKAEFNPRGQVILNVLRYAQENDLAVRDVWQLDKDLSENRDDDDSIETLIRIRFDAPEYPNVYAEAPRGER